MIKSRFATVVHILTFLAKFPDDWQPSSLIAKSMNINPVMVRREIAVLKEKGFLQSKEGKAGGLKLAKPAAEIRLSELFSLVKGDDHILGFCTKVINEDCPVGRSMNSNLTDLYTGIEETIEAELSEVTLEEFTSRFGDS